MLTGIEKQIPCPQGIAAVLIPITSPREFTSGPPELPGLRAASVWMTLSINRPPVERNERPRALTTPVVTVHWKPNGFPIAITSSPILIPWESPREATGSPCPCTRTTAMSVNGSSPIRSPWSSLPSASVTLMAAAL